MARPFASRPFALRPFALRPFALLAVVACQPPLRSAPPPPTPAPSPPEAAAIAEPPTVRREFRGVWVATVGNIDWPSKPGLSTADQQKELLEILDRSAALRLNAVVLQVRPSTDALYESSLEPWAEYLTGVSGRAPSPRWDPLAFAVREAHARGIELHAWINPYRARAAGAKSPPPADHVSRVRPAIVREYAKQLWLDPGEPETMAWSLRVIADIVRRYDIDGIHIDDYFYPYPVNDAKGVKVEFPDSTSYARYRAGGGTLDRDAWRRDNVDRFVRAMYETAKRERPGVKVGISPFGIWRPGEPAGICCFDAYKQLNADSKRWLQEGWADYFTPQLYWKISATQQSYPRLLDWWVQANTRGRQLWIGNYLSRITGAADSWTVAEIDSQIRLTRAQPGSTGNVHFSMKALLRNVAGVGDSLAAGVYAEPALVPAMPWLPGRAPAAPHVAYRAGPPSVVELAAGAGGDAPWLWVVQARYDATWTTDVVPAVRRSVTLRPPATRGAPDAVHVTAIDRAGRESAPTTVTRARPASGSPGPSLR